MTALKHLATSISFAGGLAVTAAGGWYAFELVPKPVTTGVGIAAIICLFLAWQFLLVCFALGAVLMGAAGGEANFILAVPLGILSGVVSGMFVAAYGGACFGAFSGILTGLTAGWLRHRLFSRSADQRSEDLRSSQ